MKRVIIKIPKSKNGKWLLGLGGRPRPMARCDTLLNRVKRELPSWLKVNGKTSVITKRYIHTKWTKENESLNSTDANYLLYTLSCFLEDYLSPKTLNKFKKSYISMIG